LSSIAPKTPLSLLAVLLLATSATAVSAGTLVVRSSGPSARAYPAGKALADSGRITLRDNDVVVILDGRGTRTLRGPGVFSPTQASPANDLRNEPGVLASRAPDPRRRIGAVRSVSGRTTRSPSIWFVDVDRSSTVCVPGPDNVTLWRAGADEPVTLTVTSLADGRSESVEWGRGISHMAWPASLGVSEGAQYRLNWNGAVEPTTIKFAMLGPGPSGIEDMAQGLIRRGCQAQLDLLIETVSVPATVSPPGG
jgi:hypothetical protein